MYAECAADDEMCIFGIGVNLFVFDFYLFLYFCHYSLYKCSRNIWTFSYTIKFEKLGNVYAEVKNI